MKRVIITNPFVGILYMQVCAIHDASNEEILAICNKENPSGTTNGWGVVIREGDMKPVQCKEYSERKHFLISC